MDAVALLAEALAAGLRLEVADDQVIVRGPKAAEPLVRRLREAKPAILRLLAGPAPAERGRPALDPTTLREVLGDHTDPHDLAILKFEVWQALRAIETGIHTGTLPPRRVIRGHPLADWLSLDDIARLLRERGRG